MGGLTIYHIKSHLQKYRLSIRLPEPEQLLVDRKRKRSASDKLPNLPLKHQQLEPPGFGLQPRNSASSSGRDGRGDSTEAGRAVGGGSPISQHPANSEAQSPGAGAAAGAVQVDLTQALCTLKAEAGPQQPRGEPQVGGEEVPPGATPPPSEGVQGASLEQLQQLMAEEGGENDSGKYNSSLIDQIAQVMHSP